MIQEVLRYLVEEGLVDPYREGSWRLMSEQSLAMSVPEGLRDVIGKRLTRLSKECNRVAGIAMVIGREFRLDVLQRVADVPQEELFGALEEATSVGILEERSAVGAGVSYRFAHAFFRQTLYEETIAPRRNRMHQQVGRALEEVHVGRLREHLAELAEHFSHSSDFEDLAKAVQYGDMAAERSVAVYAYGEAARLLERALQVQEVLDPDDRAKRCDLLLSLGEALMPAGEPRRVVDDIAPEALGLAEAVSDQAGASRTCRLALDAIRRYGSGMISGSPEYLQWGQRADRYAEPGTTDRVYADIRLATRRVSEGKRTEGRALSLRALELARKLQDTEAIYTASRNFLDSVPPHREVDWLRLVREMSSHGHAGVTAANLGSWLQIGGSVLMDWGDRAGAEALWEQLRQLAGSTNDTGVLINSLSVIPKLSYLDGRLSEAVSASDHLLRTAEELGAPLRGRMWASVTSWRPLVYMGRGEEALTALSELSELSGIDYSWVGVEIHLGHSAEAREALQGEEAKHGPQDDRHFTGALVGWLETAILAGNKELCSVLPNCWLPRRI